MESQSETEYTQDERHTDFWKSAVSKSVTHTRKEKDMYTLFKVVVLMSECRPIRQINPGMGAGKVVLTLHPWFTYPQLQCELKNIVQETWVWYFLLIKGNNCLLNKVQDGCKRLKAIGVNYLS